MTDQQLIRRYAETRDEGAFRQIVQAHIDLVWSSAKRQVRDASLADDVTQVVFTVLAQKAGKIQSDAVLPGWLMITTRFVANRFLVAAHRRGKHEQEAAQMSQASHIHDDSWEELRPYLDEGIAWLGPSERDAIVLRYFKGMSLRETGAALGVPENTAAKRISRGIERLRKYFTRRGITAAAPAITAMIAAHALEAAPAELASAVSATAVAASATAATGPVALAAQEAMRAMFWAKAKLIIGFAGAAAAGGAGLLIGLQWFGQSARPNTPPVAAASASIPAALTADEVRRSWGPEWAGFPIAAGWPLAMPGQVTGTPATADLDGDGDLEIVVPSMMRQGGVLHPEATIAAVLHAFHHDGRPVKGWPIVLLDQAGRELDRRSRPNYCENWNSSPSVADLDADGRDEIVITAPSPYTGPAGRGIDATHIITGDGTRKTPPTGLAGGEVWSSMPLIDVDGDGKLDVLCRTIAINAEGKPLAGWPLMSGFAPCIGDANGDGRPEVYYSSYVPKGALHGLNHQGKPIVGWPQEVSRQCLFPPVMGDIDGDGKMEIVAVDQGLHILAWSWHGRALLPIVADNGMTGIFKERVAAGQASPTLADLDGDGAAEVIVLDFRDRPTLRAWRGDGKGLHAEDGAIVVLPQISDAGGVTVADLGGDGVMDLFVGTFWVQLGRDGKTTVTPLLPQPAPTDGGCLITDVDGDRKADIVFGTVDGQAFIYNTGKAYDPAQVQWATPNGNQRHTGCWSAPARISKVRP